MPISHESKLYAVEDCKISQLTSDPAAGSPVYATSKDVPGIKELTLGGDLASVELRGDNTLLDSNSSLSSITLSVTHAKVSLDVLAIILGGTVTDSGTGTAEVATYLRDKVDNLNYFKIEGKTPTSGVDTIGGDAHIIGHKCILSSFPEIGLAEEDFRIVSFECKLVPLISTGDWFSIVLNETAAVIA